MLKIEPANVPILALSEIPTLGLWHSTVVNFFAPTTSTWWILWKDQEFSLLHYVYTLRSMDFRDSITLEFSDACLVRKCLKSGQSVQNWHCCVMSEIHTLLSGFQTHFVTENLIRKSSDFRHLQWVSKIGTVSGFQTLIGTKCPKSVLPSLDYSQRLKTELSVWQTKQNCVGFSLFLFGC